MGNVISTDFAGSHAKDLAKTGARLMKGASWKKQRIISIIPAGESIPTRVYLSHVNLAFPPNNGAYRLVAQGLEVGHAYSSCIESILADKELSKWEYILTIEHDNCPPWDGVLRLVEAMEEHPEYACISGLYFTKGPLGVAQIWGDPKDTVLNFRPQVPVDGQIVECCGTGMGFALWRLSMFKDEKLRRPWFVTSTQAGGLSTQDLYFWADARKHGYRCAVDCRVKVGHYDQASDYMW
jgi:hypothetical protein